MEQIALGKNCSGFIVSQGQFWLSSRLLSMHIFYPYIILFFLVGI